MTHATHNSIGARACVSRRGYSFIELLAVLSIITILGAVSVPALVAARSASIPALAGRVESELVLARSRAMSQGEAQGVRISHWEVVPVVVAAGVGGGGGGSVVVGDGPLGDIATPLDPKGYRPGMIRSMLSGTGSAESALTIWFDADGEPHARDASGARLPAWTGDARIDVGTSQSTQFVVRVHRVSGLVEVDAP